MLRLKWQTFVKNPFKVCTANILIHILSLPCRQRTWWKNGCSKSHPSSNASSTRAARFLHCLRRVVRLRWTMPSLQVIFAPASLAGSFNFKKERKRLKCSWVVNGLIWSEIQVYLLEWLWALASWLGIGECPDTELVLLATSLDSTLLCSGAPIWRMIRMIDHS